MNHACENNNLEAVFFLAAKRAYHLPLRIALLAVRYGFVAEHPCRAPVRPRLSTFLERFTNFVCWGQRHFERRGAHVRLRACIPRVPQGQAVSRGCQMPVRPARMPKVHLGGKIDGRKRFTLLLPRGGISASHRIHTHFVPGRSHSPQIPIPSVFHDFI